MGDPVTNIESERDALRQSLKSCSEREHFFAEQHRYFAAQAETAEALLETALELVAGTDLEHVAVSPMNEPLDVYIERCLPGFAKRRAERRAEYEV